MSNTSSPCQSTRQHYALVATTVKLARFLRASNPNPFKIAHAVLETDDAHATTNIDQPGRVKTLHCSISEIKFDEEIEEAEATANPEGQSNIDDVLANKKHRYDMDIC